MTLQLISHALCPYVQRAVITLTEKGVDFERIYIDLANKPAWFLDISPLGKTPVLVVDQIAIFESAVILEYIEETQPTPLHPESAIARASHRAWMEFGSAVLNDIAGFYSAADAQVFDEKVSALRTKFCRLEGAVSPGPYFDGDEFRLVDVVFAPVFRYFDVFDEIGDFGFFAGLPRVQAWRKALARRPSVRTAVTSDYPVLLKDFIQRRNSYLSTLVEEPYVRQNMLHE